MIEAVGANASPSKRPKGKPKVFACPACGGTITLNAVGHTIRAFCAHCGSTIDTGDENFRIVDRAHKKLPVSTIPIGSTGALQGKRWQVIGFMKKHDQASNFSWDEYLLFNPFYGFRFLIAAEGHWTLMKVVKQTGMDMPGLQKIEFDGSEFSLFHRGVAVVDAVAGEFYWRVQKGDKANVADFIAPPRQLSTETCDDEITVAIGDYIQPKELTRAFGLKSRLAKPIGVAANQPSPFASTWRAVHSTYLLSLLVATVVQLAFVTFAKNEVVTLEHFTVAAGATDKTIATQPFLLASGIANVEVETETAFQNHWLELGLSLVSESADQSYNGSQVVEYYSGSDSDGTWSEGTQRETTLIPSIPGGQYRLLIDPDSDLLRANQPAAFTVTVRRDVPSWINYLVAVLVATLYPVYLGLRHFSFEKRRWSESNFAPAMYRSSDDE